MLPLNTNSWDCFKLPRITFSSRSKYFSKSLLCGCVTDEGMIEITYYVRNGRGGWLGKLGIISHFSQVKGSIILPSALRNKSRQKWNKSWPQLSSLSVLVKVKFPWDPLLWLLCKVSLKVRPAFGEGGSPSLQIWCPHRRGRWVMEKRRK